MPSDSFIAALPKTELHLHLVGSASTETVRILARRRPDVGVPTDPEELARFYTFTDFAHFIEVYVAVDRLIRDPEDIVTLVVGAARDAAASNVRWAELTVTASTHLAAGIGGDELRDALHKGRAQAREQHGVELGWIIDIPGEHGLGAADATVQFLTEHRPKGTVAIGLAGIEQDVPRAQFAEHVEAARALGLHAVIHAGESTGAETVRSALDDLHADRIGHGIRAADDPELLARLVVERVPLEVCVTSNLRTNVVPSLGEHPITTLLTAGATVTLSTDDPGMFATNLNHEYRLVSDLARLDEHEAARIARTGFESSFAPVTVKDKAFAELDALF